MTHPLDGAARAAVCIAYRRYGMGRFRPTARNPELLAYRHAERRGWLWEPDDGWYALTPDGVAETEGYRLEEPA